MIVCKHVYPTKTGGCNHYPDGGIACENGCLLQVFSYFRFARMGVIQRGGGYTLPSKSPLAFPSQALQWEITVFHHIIIQLWTMDMYISVYIYIYPLHGNICTCKKIIIYKYICMTIWDLGCFHSQLSLPERWSVGSLKFPALHHAMVRISWLGNACARAQTHTHTHK